MTLDFCKFKRTVARRLNRIGSLPAYSLLRQPIFEIRPFVCCAEDGKRHFQCF